jgi:hypothetical protein
MTQVQHAGRIKYFYNCWRKITSNEVILNWLKNGYSIPFEKQVVQDFVPQINWSLTEKADIYVAIQNLMQLGAITPCTPCDDQFISSTFLAPKSNGGKRFILNLEKLNRFIPKEHFKMEDHRTAAKLIPNHGYMATVDLKEAYLLIPIAAHSRKYLRFHFEDDNSFLLTYEFTALPYGLSLAPRTFTKIMREVITYLRGQGHKSVFFLDDILCIGDNYKECLDNVQQTVNLLKCLGFVINIQKSMLEPQQVCRYLGFMFDSVHMTLSLTTEKREKIAVLVNTFLSLPICTIREFSQLIGTLIAACPAVKYGWLYTRILERQKFLALQRDSNYNKKIKLPEVILKDLNWWKSRISSCSFSLLPLEYTLEIFSDASRTGWGAYANNSRTHGAWRSEERVFHINQLELLAVFLGLKYFAHSRHNCSILLRIDNTTAISYVNRMGGVQFPHLNELSRQIWQWCEERNIWIFASYINTKDNIEADRESRKYNPDTEWELSNHAFRRIIHKFGHPDIDLFASRANAKCQAYVSWRRDSDAIAVDAFTLNWSRNFFYCFPPFSVILKSLHKIIHDKATGILVFPVWPSQAWYPLLMSLIQSDIIYMNPDEHLVCSDYRTRSPFLKHLILGAAVLSG